MKAGKKSEEYFNKASKGLDDDMVTTFKKNNVEVVTLTPPNTTPGSRWRRKAPTSSSPRKYPDGKKLIDEALAVK